MLDEHGTNPASQEWCLDHPELCSAQPPAQQPQQPPEKCGPEYRKVYYSSPADAVAITINMRNAIYGAKPARIRLCVSPKNFRFTLTNVQVYVYADGRRVYMDNLGTVTATVCRDIQVPPPRLTSTYVQRRIEFRIYATVGEGNKRQIATKSCDGATYGIYEVPVWRGPNPVVITHRETVTWYATPSEARMSAGAPSGGGKIAFQLSANPLVIRKPFHVEKGISYSNAEIYVSVSPEPVENIYFLGVEIPGAVYRSDKGCYFYGPLRIYRYGCGRLGSYKCKIVIAPQRSGTYRVPIKACIYRQVTVQGRGGKYTSRSEPVKCTTFTAEVSFYQVAPQKPTQPPPTQPPQQPPTAQAAATRQPQQPQPPQPTPTTQPSPTPQQPSQPSQPTQPLWSIPPQPPPPQPQPPATPAQPAYPGPMPEWCLDHPELCSAQPPAQQPQQPPEELSPTPPPSPPLVPVEGGGEQGEGQQPGQPQPGAQQSYGLLLGGAVLFLVAGAAIFAVSSLAKAESKKHAERLEEIKRRLEQHQPPSP